MLNCVATRSIYMYARMVHSIVMYFVHVGTLNSSFQLTSVGCGYSELQGFTHPFRQNAPPGQPNNLGNEQWCMSPSLSVAINQEDQLETLVSYQVKLLGKEPSSFHNTAIEMNSLRHGTPAHVSCLCGCIISCEVSQFPWKLIKLLRVPLINLWSPLPPFIMKLNQQRALLGYQG